jgi:RNA polymerase sigma-70 factor (ECF subfamily)
MNRNSEQVLTEYLVINCQLGDADALHQLLTIWYPKLLRYAKRQLGDEQKAQDAVQITLEMVSKSIRQLKDPAAFAKWVYQVLQGKSVDLIRSKQRQDKLCAEYSQYQESIDQSMVENEDQNSDFSRLLAGLPIEVYQLVHLHYLEGFNMQEIGELLGVPSGTIKSRLHHARQLIKHHLSTDPSRRD